MYQVLKVIFLCQKVWPRVMDLLQPYSSSVGRSTFTFHFTYSTTEFE